MVYGVKGRSLIHLFLRSYRNCSCIRPRVVAIAAWCTVLWICPTCCLQSPLRLMSLLMANYIRVYFWGWKQCCLSASKPPPHPISCTYTHTHTRYCFTVCSSLIFFFLFTLSRLCWLSGAASSWGAAAFGSDKIPSGGTLSTPAILALLSAAVCRQTHQAEAGRGTASTAAALLPSVAPRTAEYQGRVKCAFRCVCAEMYCLYRGKG